MDLVILRSAVKQALKVALNGLLVFHADIELYKLVILLLACVATILAVLFFLTHLYGITIGISTRK